MRLDSVLRRRGAILKASTGDARSYQLSTPVGRLDAFLSHTWSTPYWMKCTTLSLEYSFGVALVWGLFVCTVVSGLIAGKWLPLVDMEDGNPRGPYCALLCPIVFHAVLHFGADVTSLVPRRWRMSPLVFLDKVCIHQTDAQVKAKGIANLDKIAVKSDTFVILQADDYLQRLWTVFEFGSVLLVHTSPSIVVLPVTMAPPVLFSCILFAMNQLLAFTSETALVAAFGMHSVVRFYGPLLVHVTTLLLGNLSLRSGHRESERRVNELADFSILTARCAVEEDRAVVHRKIALMMQATGTMEAGDDLLRAFDVHVRTRLPPAMEGLPPPDEARPHGVRDLPGECL